MALGASLFVFGILWLFVSSSLAYLLITSQRNPLFLAQMQFAIQMAGILIATIGAGLLTYGHASRTNGAPKQTMSG
jgi:hypothetical protein